MNLFDPSVLRSAIRAAPPPAPPAGARLPGEAAGAEAATEQARVAARISGLGTDRHASERVRQGLVDPAYTRLGRAIARGWNPARALPESSAAIWARRRAQNAALSFKIMAETARTYATTGSPIAAGEEPEEGVRADLRDPLSPLQDGRAARETYRQYMRGKFIEGRTAKVLVTQHADGRVEAGLVQSSGDLDVDRAALEDIRAAASMLEPAPDEPAGKRRSLWSMRLKIIIHPPLPLGGFTFDEVLEDSSELELPMGRKLLKRVQLEAVYDDDSRFTTPPEPSIEAAAPASP